MKKYILMGLAFSLLCTQHCLRAYEETVSPPEGFFYTFSLDVPEDVQTFAIALFLCGIETHKKYDSYRTYALESETAVLQVRPRDRVPGDKDFIQMLGYEYVLSELWRSEPRWNGRILLVGDSTQTQ